MAFPPHAHCFISWLHIALEYAPQASPVFRKSPMFKGKSVENLLKHAPHFRQVASLPFLLYAKHSLLSLILSFAAYRTFQERLRNMFFLRCVDVPATSSSLLVALTSLSRSPFLQATHLPPIHSNFNILHNSTYSRDAPCLLISSKPI
jgi:hypothetical protein